VVSVLAAIGIPFSILAENPPQTIDVSSIPAQVVEEVIIPIPQEIFSSLDKLGEHNWRRHLLKRDVKINANRSRTALLFGLVISEGFIAVQAEDPEEVKRVGRDVLNLSGALGVKSAVQGHANAIMEGAEASDWQVVRRELDRTRQTVIDTMNELRDNEFAELVSIGGWLGGTRALSALVTERFSTDASELLNQPDLLVQISRRFRELPPGSRRGEVFDQVTSTLENLKPLMRTDRNGEISPATVERIHQLTADLTDAVFQR
jgi:hypothetical protein